MELLAAKSYNRDTSNSTRPAARTTSGSWILVKRDHTTLFLSVPRLRLSRSGEGVPGMWQIGQSRLGCEAKVLIFFQWLSVLASGLAKEDLRPSAPRRARPTTQVLSRLIRPTAGLQDLPRTCFGSNMTPWHSRDTAPVQGHLAHKKQPPTRTLP
jgi:hypothetical protein